MTFLDAEFADTTDSFCTAIPAPSAKPFRPIQYLGNKLRALTTILDASADLINSGGHVVDMFTGTSVVAQGFAGRGYRVSALDTQQYAVTFGLALLGVGRKPNESCGSTLFSRLGIASKNPLLRAPWQGLVEREQQAISQGSGAAVDALSSELPLIWRDTHHPLRQHVEQGTHRTAIGETALLTSIYAGTYFGIGQALALDELRQAVELARRTGQLSEWQYQSALTAIMSAASSAAHSAGKHFAQPLNAGSRRNERFQNGRLLQDRRVDVVQEFLDACDAINQRAVASDRGHAAVKASAEKFATAGDGADLYYLDPPYTAQQYSRFYHVLETICTYEYPKLFTDGRITSGLYPANRYKSAFSSKRKALPAFRTIIETARSNDAALAISYSQSAADSGGNARMITLDELLGLCVTEFGRSKVDWFQLDHRYRQFNSAASSNAFRDDPEILITCKPR